MNIIIIGINSDMEEEILTLFLKDVKKTRKKYLPSIR